MGAFCSTGVPPDRQHTASRLSLLAADAERSSSSLKRGASFTNTVADELETAELAGRLVLGTFFLLEAAMYVGLAGFVIFFPALASTGFPMYLPEEMVSDPVRRARERRRARVRGDRANTPRAPSERRAAARDQEPQGPVIGTRASRAQSSHRDPSPLFKWPSAGRRAVSAPALACSRRASSAPR
jgi:hypothetical protein